MKTPTTASVPHFLGLGKFSCLCFDFLCSWNALVAVGFFIFYGIVVCEPYDEIVATVVGVPPTTLFGVGLIKCVSAIKGAHIPGQPGPILRKRYQSPLRLHHKTPRSLRW